MKFVRIVHRVYICSSINGCCSFTINLTISHLFCLLSRLIARNIRERCHYKSAMHINANTVLYGGTVILVPYGKHHVEK